MNFATTRLAVVALLALGASATVARAQELYKKCVDSTVFISHTAKGGGFSMGSGSLIDADQKYVLTNFHVVDYEKFVFVQFPMYDKKGVRITDKKQYFEAVPKGGYSKGEVLFRDKNRDLALVRLDKIPDGTRAIPLAKKSVTVGEEVINIGSPGTVNHVFSTTRGEVRAVGLEEFDVGGGDEVLHIKCKMVTTTNAINPGDSGGPLINSLGHQVGVTQSGHTRAQNVNHFVDVEEVWGFLKEKKVSIKDLTTAASPQVREHTPKGKKGPPNNPRNPANAPKVTEPSESPTPTPVPSESEKPVTPKVDETPAPATATAKEEAEALKLFNQAKLFDSDDLRETHVSKLKNIIQKYPATKAAKEAKKRLESLGVK